MQDSTGEQTTETVQRCRRYSEQYSYDEGMKGRGGAYTGNHVNRTCEVTAGAPVEATVWHYQTSKTPEHLDYTQIHTACDEGDSTQCELWLGTYKFYTAVNSAGVHEPVRFAFTGHNVVLGGSHFDEYVMDYHSVSARRSGTTSCAMPCVMACYLMCASTRYCWLRHVWCGHDVGDGGDTARQLVQATDGNGLPPG